MHLRSSALLAAFVLGLTASVTALPDPNPITGRDEKPGKQSSSKTLGSESRGLDTTGFDAKLAAREGDGTCSLEFDFLSLNCKSAVDDFMKFGGSDEKKDACWHETTGNSTTRIEAHVCDLDLELSGDAVLSVSRPGTNASMIFMGANRKDDTFFIKPTEAIKPIGSTTSS